MHRLPLRLPLRLFCPHVVLQVPHCPHMRDLAGAAVDPEEAEEGPAHRKAQQEVLRNEGMRMEGAMGVLSTAGQRRRDQSIINRKTSNASSFGT